MELNEIREATIEDEKRGDASYAECFSPKDRILWRTMIGILVQIGQQVKSIH
jgi:SP family sugar:H+ symporter-like MFS transporter